jgi:transcriptional regulator of acetoin/glycerol metabolism
MVRERRRGAVSEVRPQIARSWRRCELIGVSPGVSLEFADREFDGESRLVRAAQGVLDRLATELDDTRTCVILADTDARILDRRMGMSSLSRGLDRVSAFPGVVYDEARAGTNGLGTVVEERRPVAVRGAEHFAEQLKSFTCVGVPIVHPITGAFEGILDLTCLASETNALMLPLLLEASREVREHLLAESSASEQALLASFLQVTRRTRHPVVCLNDQIVITNDAARGLDPADYALLWEQFASRGDRTMRQTVSDLELSEGRVYEARFGPVEAGPITAGAIFELKPPRRAQRSGLRRARTPGSPSLGATLVGRSDAWRRVLAEVELHAGHDHPVLVAGERGVGKLACAAAVHAGGRHRLAALTVLDAALSAVDVDRQWIEPLQEALGSPDGTLVLHHVDVLRDRALVATTALLDQRDHAVGPRLLATVSDTASRDGDLGALLDRFDARILVPPLRSRSEDVIDLFEAFSRREDGWSGSAPPEVLRELMRYRWPGNAREVRHVVQAVLLRRPSGQITIDDLPLEIRTDVVPPGLSRMATLEREAILDALRDTGGNKQAAADRLGVSRSTLYRKLSAYSTW